MIVPAHKKDAKSLQEQSHARYEHDLFISGNH